MVHLSERLKCIYDMVPYAVCADVGADHGKLIISLVENDRIPKGYAIENKNGPYNRLLKAIIDSGYIERIVPLLSDGIRDLPPSVKTIVLAGLGGNLINQILKKHIEKLFNVDTIIVDAHTNVKSVRQFISQNGFIIAEERMVKEDGVIYEIVKFIRAQRAIYSDEDLEFGPKLSEEKCALFKEKYQNRINQIESILKNDKLPHSRIIKLEEEKNKLRNLIS